MRLLCQQFGVGFFAVSRSLPERNVTAQALVALDAQMQKKTTAATTITHIRSQPTCSNIHAGAY